MKPKLQILLIEDSHAYRKGVAHALADRPDMELVKQFGTAEIALCNLEQVTLDIILLDLKLPGMSGLEALPLIRNLIPETKVIILTQSDREADVLKAIELGASGYLLKSSSIEQLIKGIRLVRDGGATLDPHLARFILDSLQKKLNKTTSQKHPLSNRELEILKLIAKGLAQKEIAIELKISTYTVTEYIHNIYAKLDVPNAPAAVAKGYHIGLFPDSIN